ncbi:hypothetical protein [Rubrivirga sp. IMCC43871]|uniref:hypothetical protein n=1 Tax=Rubrivirga sp. IMCC43871 TaxID=3391575 RepID=UPI00398F95DE
MGSSGSGKSTLARAMGARLGLPVIHLDQHYWQPGWAEPTRGAWEATVDRLMTADAWVMDGTFSGTLAKRLAVADTAVLLDRSRWLCLWRVVRRRIRYHGRSRPDMTEGCPERVNRSFLHYILSFPEARRPGILARIAAANLCLVRLRSDREVSAFLASLGG